MEAAETDAIAKPKMALTVHEQLLTPSTQPREQDPRDR